MRLFGPSANRYAVPFPPVAWVPPSLADRPDRRTPRFSLAARGRSSLKQEWLQRTGNAQPPARATTKGGASDPGQPTVLRRGEGRNGPRKPPAPDSVDDNPNFYERFDAGMAKVMAVSILMVLVLAGLVLLMQWLEPAKKP